MQSGPQRLTELRYQRKRQSSPGCPWMNLIGNFVLKRGLRQQQSSQSPQLSSPRPLLISSLEMTYLLGKECAVIRGNQGTRCYEALAPMWAKRKITFRTPPQKEGLIGIPWLVWSLCTHSRVRPGKERGQSSGFS